MPTVRRTGSTGRIRARFDARATGSGNCAGRPKMRLAVTTRREVLTPTARLCSNTAHKPDVSLRGSSHPSPSRSLRERRPLSSSPLTVEQYQRQYRRLEKAVRDLRSAGSLLQAIARAYYIVHATATYAAARYGVTVTHFRQGREAESGDFTHNSIPDVVRALYSGNKSGRASPGSTPGIGSGHVGDIQAMRYTELLQRDRKDADYGPTDVLEPYTRRQADERLTWANMLVEDLRKLL
jgi:hypothetical protein